MVEFPRIALRSMVLGPYLATYDPGIILNYVVAM